MEADKLRQEDGSFPAYAWPGGYPMIYLDAQGNTLCPDCASKEDEYSAPTVSGDVYWEGPDVQCDDCGKTIESAYGDPETE